MLTYISLFEHFPRWFLILLKKLGQHKLLYYPFRRPERAFAAVPATRTATQ